ncbi:MAG: hypothetical protein R3C05_31400 [Pirellulaceae bacterium]
MGSGAEQCILVYDYKSSNVVYRKRADADSIAFSPNGKHLCCIERNGVSIIELTTFSSKRFDESYTGLPLYCKFLSDKSVIAGQLFNSLALYNLSSFRKSKSYTINGEVIQIWTGSTGLNLATWNDEGEVAFYRIINLESGDTVFYADCFRGKPTWLRDNVFIMNSGIFGVSPHIVDMITGERLLEFRTTADALPVASRGKNGRLVLLESLMQRIEQSTKHIEIWNAEVFEKLFDIPAKTGRSTFCCNDQAVAILEFDIAGCYLRQVDIGSGATIDHTVLPERLSSMSCPLNDERLLLTVQNNGLLVGIQLVELE